MSPTNLLATLAIILTASTCTAEDVLVQVQSVVEGRTYPNGSPIIVDSTETIATPGSTFRTKIRNGDEWTVVKGKLSKPVDGKYHVEYEQNVAVDQQFSGGVFAPEVTTIRVCPENAELEKPVLIGKCYTRARWTGPRGRAHNSSTCNAWVRVELTLKPAKAYYDDWPTFPVEQRTREGSIGRTWFSENSIRTLGFENETHPESVKVSPSADGEILQIGDQTLIPIKR